MKKLGVIILNWNGIRLLKEFLPTASAHTVSNEADLIVADNGSTDGSVAWIHANHPEVKVLELGENFGFAEGYNRAVAALDYPYVVLLNSDVEVTPDWWRPMLGLLENNPEVGAVQPKILSYRDRSSFEYAGAAGGYIDALSGIHGAAAVFSTDWSGMKANTTEPPRGGLGLRSLHGHALGPLPQTGRTRRQLLRPHGGDRLMCEDTARRTEGGGHQRFSRLSCGRSPLSIRGIRKRRTLTFGTISCCSTRIFRDKKADASFYSADLRTHWLSDCSLLKGDMPNARAILRAHSDFRKMKKSYSELPADDIFPQTPRHGPLRSGVKIPPRKK